MKIFVTGGAGFIGSNFIRRVLREEKHEVVNYDKLNYAGNLANLEHVENEPRYRFFRGDICDSRFVHQAMQGCDCVVHFAAESHVDRSIFDPEPVIDTNIRGTFVLLQVARELKLQRFVHVSTDEVYGDLGQGQCSHEQFPLRPNSPYAASKASSDLLVQSFVRTYRFPALITRASNNYGPYQFPEKFMPLMICNALEEKPLPIYGDGLQERDWLHVEDHCAAIYAVLLHGRIGETYNIGGGNVIDNLSMAKRLLKILRKRETLLTYVSDRPGHDRRYALDCNKIKAELSWKPTIKLEDGLARTAQWYLTNPEWISGVRNGEYKKYYEAHYMHREQSLKNLTNRQN